MFFGVNLAPFPGEEILDYLAQGRFVRVLTVLWSQSLSILRLRITLRRGPTRRLLNRRNLPKAATNTCIIPGLREAKEKEKK